MVKMTEIEILRQKVAKLQETLDTRNEEYAGLAFNFNYLRNQLLEVTKRAENAEEELQKIKESY